MQTTKKDIGLAHISVMLMSLAGVFGQLVNESSLIITLGRVAISFVVLLIILSVKKTNLRLESKKDYGVALLAGVVLAVHWSTFFQSIQMSTVAIGIITFSTFPLFLTFLEPLVYHENIQKKNIVSSLILLIGVLITIPEFSLDNQMTIGIVWGMISSLAYAILSLLNRYLSNRYEGMKICVYEQGTASVLLLPTLFLVRTTIETADVLGIVAIGLFCTAFAYSIYVSVQKNVQAQTMGLISGMETVYGIVYAFILLSEVPSMQEMAGAIIILGVSLYSSIASTR
ncbi:MAG: DMT family transporter [Eubacteriales bacterium]